ncbi:MAG: glycoside hydrolase family 99-like domain-containing protein, partial [Azoarcus sp.]|nr:glycoside hydrolase family 99-like domain-containing protein [Azoarcus sp.]
MTEVANTSAATRNRLIVYVATDDPTITARATQIDDAERTTIAVSVRERTDTPTIAFLQAFASASSIAPPSDSDLVCRIDYRLADLDEVDRRIVRSFAHSLLDSDYLDTAVAAITETPQIGLATPAGLPRIALERAGDDTLVPRLAKQLGLPLQAFADTFFFPQPMHFLRGGLYNALAQRHANATASDEQALALGFHALCKASGLASTDLSPKPQVADADDLRRHEAQVLARATKRGRHAEFRPRVRRDDLPAQPSLKVIAYYLPQFHAIPENDHWWGTGFTEWTNVSKAVPRFIGHEQPRFPTDLGYYDLNRPEIMAHQIELARSHGVHGFCFYYYWFNGRTLLERPLENFLADASLDMPFCLCWANENWTRRWDGQEDEVLMAQSHSPRDDLRFIEHIAPYLRDARYIRVDGKPLLLVYRASLLDDARATAQRWRQWCRDNDIGEICLAAVCSFDIDDPRPFGFDVAVEFPPHQLRNMPPINPSLTFIDRAFAGEVLDYRETVLLSALGKYPETAKPFPMLHGVMTGWDNDARRNGRGRVFHHASPSAYANWLRLAASHTHRHNPPELQYVFVNAWNEWAEGAYLEPDRRFGHAHLAATADTLRTVEPRR